MMKSFLEDFLFILGVALIIYQTWLLYMPLAIYMLGVFLIVISFNINKKPNEEKKKEV
jgi:ABC-type bacteriocin/lantibiotic exporter with double-glycine peptidase domain